MADSSNMEMVVVAIPREDDRVWKISSEKIPHMTMLYLGEPNWTAEQTINAVQYIGHAASMLNRFGMNVDRRGKLGPNEADVLFFSKNWGFKRLLDFQAGLLADSDIKLAYLQAEQYPEWTPHLTLGYPETPAKPDDRDYPIGWVEFDRIAIWTGDSEGPTFQLDDNDSMEVAMSDIPAGFDLEDVLEHYGVKGMKWGQHKKNKHLTPGRKQTDPHSEDATRVGTIKTRVGEQKTTKILSNKELRDAIDRMRLEEDFTKLSKGLDQTRREKSAKFITKLLSDTGKQTADQVVKSQTRSVVDEAIKKAGK